MPTYTEEEISLCKAKEATKRRVFSIPWSWSSVLDCTKKWSFLCLNLEKAMIFFFLHIFVQDYVKYVGLWVCFSVLNFLWIVDCGFASQCWIFYQIFRRISSGMYIVLMVIVGKDLIVAFWSWILMQLWTWTTIWLHCQTQAIHGRAEAKVTKVYAWRKLWVGCMIRVFQSLLWN